MNDIVDALASLDFRPPLFGKGYDRTQVDNLVRELMGAAGSGHDLAAIVERTTLTEAPRAQAYARSDVDSALAAVVRSARTGPIGRAVEEVRFAPTRMGGYDMGEVDRFLDELVAAEVRGEQVAPLAARAAFTTTFARETYRKREVDSFLETLVLKNEGVRLARQTNTPTWHFQLHQDGSAPGTPAWIRGTTFTRQPFLGAYDAEAVATLREALAAALEDGGRLEEVIRAADLSPSVRSVGCDIASVEHWLDLVRSGGVEVKDEDDVVIRRIRGVRFAPVRLRTGYDMGGVDRLLDDLVAARRRREPLATMIRQARLAEVTFREGYSVGDVDAFLAQLVADERV